MRTRLLVENPNDIVFTLKIEATTREFERIRDILDRVPSSQDGWPEAHSLVRQLNDLLAQARRIFWAEDTPPTTEGAVADVP